MLRTGLKLLTILLALSFSNCFRATCLQEMCLGPQNSGDFIEDQNEDFKPERVHQTPLVSTTLDLILIPIEQNYILNQNRRLRIAIAYNEKLGIAFRDRAIINYEWRRKSAYQESFSGLFAEDHVILDLDPIEYPGISENSNAENRKASKKIVFIMTIIIGDTNQNGILENKGDQIALYLMDTSSMQAKMISPVDASLLENQSIVQALLEGIHEHRRFDYYKASSTYYSVSGDSIFFHASLKNSKASQLYHYSINKNRLEKIGKPDPGDS